jgi:hypothetical protein
MTRMLLELTLNRSSNSHVSRLALSFQCLLMSVAVLPSSGEAGSSSQSLHESFEQRRGLKTDIQNPDINMDTKEAFAGPIK